MTIGKLAMKHSDSGRRRAICRRLTQTDAVGPLDVIGHQHLPVHTVHPRLLDLGPCAPVGPVHEAGGENKKSVKTVASG